MTGIRPPKLQNGDRKRSTSKIDSPNGKTTPSWDSDYRNSGDPTSVPQYLLCSEKNILLGKKHRMVRSVHTNIMPSPALIAPAVHAHEPPLTPLDPDGDHTIVEEKTPAPAVKPFVYQDIFETAGPDTTKYRTVVQGDSLWAMAVKEYGQPEQWRTIASANGLANPRRLRSGERLVLPAID